MGVGKRNNGRAFGGRGGSVIKMFKISNIRIEIGEEISAELIGKRFSVSPEDISDICIVKKSLDARKKNDIHYNLTVSFCLKNEKKY